MHLLDAANYVKCAWDAITSTTISNAFKKVEIIKIWQNEEEEEQKQNENSEDDEEISEDDEEFNDMFTNLIQDLASLNINVTEDEMNRFLNADNENNLEYVKAILEDANDLFIIENANDRLNHQAVENANDESSDDETEAAQTNDEEQVTFVGVNDPYDKLLDLEDQLLCKDVQNEAGEAYDTLMSSFSLFQNELRSLTMDRQITLHDAFANNKR